MGARPGLSTARERPDWESKLISTLGLGYTVVSKHCIGTTHLMVFVRDSLEKQVRDVHSAHVLTGFGQVG